MPRSLDPSKYPAEFFAMLERAAAGDPVLIPDPSPSGLRGYIQAFLRACESEGPDSPLTTRAKSLQVTCPRPDLHAADPRARDPHVLVQRRSDSIYAKRVVAALGQALAQPTWAEQVATLTKQDAPPLPWLEGREGEKK